MASTQHEQVEQAIRRRLELQDVAGAATLAIRGYGAEIYGFLVTFHRNDDDASEVFSLFNERLWRDLPTFRGDCSFRTWAYTLARHASLNYQRESRRKNKRQRPLPEGSELSQIVEQVRSNTISYLKTERQVRFDAIRRSLSVEDQTLLVLRVDRKLAWNELVRVLHDGEEPLDEIEVKRAAARLRKQYQVLKERLYEMGRNAGVVSERGDDE